MEPFLSQREKELREMMAQLEKDMIQAEEEAKIKISNRLLPRVVHVRLSEASFTLLSHHKSKSLFIRKLIENHYKNQEVKK